MNIIFTGASSFTGFWFVKELTESGARVFTTFSGKDPSGYSGIRLIRVSLLDEIVSPVYNCRFGDEQFMKLLKSEQFDVLCHHGAYVTDYSSPDFDVLHAVSENTRNIRDVLEELRKNGCNTVIFTGTVFESHEGLGDSDQAFSPYGLSKTCTWEIFRYYAGLLNMKLGKFVIPNPFGPYEEARFTTYLIKTWSAGKIADVNTPDYFRDNIHVSLLAKVYARFTEEMVQGELTSKKCYPSGYRETQGEFAERFALEMKPRLGFPCHLNLRHDHPVTEPGIRYNRDPVDTGSFGWYEKKAWDNLASYYRQYILPDVR